jgi:16S rRNA (adenine1518-N6/adenine1519-N6)-dimethyltransferase
MQGMEIAEEPLVLVVDAADSPIGAGTKDEIQQAGLYHRIVRVMVEDEHGAILLQKRSDNQQLYPGCWDNSAAGHVDEGEDYDVAAARELAEELGVTNVHLEEIGQYQSRQVVEWRQLNRFNRVYVVSITRDMPLNPSPEEVSETRWVTKHELRALVSELPDEVSDGLKEVVERYY